MKISALKIVSFCMVLSFLWGCAKNDEIPSKTIQLEQIEEMFSAINKNTDWDMSGAMLWGYFFTHNELDKLEEVKEILVSEGYDFVSISVSEKENPNDPDIYWLHVEKPEVHTPISLDQRNNEFYIFSQKHGLDSYDGMDVGPIDK
jgi:hypothetical protein